MRNSFLNSEQACDECVLCMLCYMRDFSSLAGGGGGGAHPNDMITMKDADS